MEFLIVDDDFNACGGMSQTLRSQYPDCTLHTARSLAGAIAALAAHGGIGLVLLDLNLDDSKGLDSLRALKSWCEDQGRNPRIVVVSAAADFDDQLVTQAIEHCATGFISKGLTEEVFRSAIALTLAGSIFIPQSYLAARTRPTTATPQVHLTPRERQVAGLLLQGLTYKQIARQLLSAQDEQTLSDATVRVHVQRMAWKIKSGGAAPADDVPAKAMVLAYLASRHGRAGAFA